MTGTEKRFSWEVEDGTFTTDGLEISPCSVECSVIIRSYNRYDKKREVSGTLRFPGLVEASMFFSDDGKPHCQDVTVINDRKTLELDGLIVTSPVDAEMKFRALDAELTKKK